MSAKIKLKCIKTFASEPKRFGVDFYEGKEYFGVMADNNCHYVTSTKNGTDVSLTDQEIYDHFEDVL